MAENTDSIEISFLDGPLDGLQQRRAGQIDVSVFRVVVSKNGDLQNGGEPIGEYIPIGFKDGILVLKWHWLQLA